MNFSNGYQKGLLLRLTDKKFLEQVAPLLSPRMFDGELEPVVEELLERWRDKQSCLSRTQLEQLFHRRGLKWEAPKAGDESFDVEEVSRFAEAQKIRQACSKAILYSEEGNLQKSREILGAVVEESCCSSSPHRPQPLDIIRDKAIRTQREKVQSTGLKLLDEHFRGGVGAGDLAVVLAPVSGGKSSFLCHIAASAVEQGKKVYIVTLEDTVGDLERKIQGRLTGDSTWKQTRRRVRGTCWTEAYEPESLSVLDLDRRIPREAELIVIDYADYIRSERGEGLDYHSLGSIYTGLKRIALKRKVPVWTASQVNREAYGEDERYRRNPREKKKETMILLQHVELSLRKMMVCTQAVSINQQDMEQIPDAKTGNTTATLLIVKNRHGPRFRKIPVTVNWERCQFTEGRYT